MIIIYYYQLLVIKHIYTFILTLIFKQNNDIIYFYNIMNNSPEKWVSMEEICNHLSASKDTVKKMVKQNGLPAYKLERKWKFKITEVDQWLKKHKVDSSEEDMEC
jgi:excisionase family DNA binding protein